MKFFEYILIGLQHRIDPFYVKYLQGRLVLDVGCGCGDFLARDPENTVGVDIDSKLVSQCRERGYTAYCMSALSLDFPAASFDAVHAAQLIEHFGPTDAAHLLSEVARVLRPGGYFLLTTPGVRNVWNTFSHVRPYPPASFRKLLASATENYIREGEIELELDLECVQGYRSYSPNRGIMFVLSIFDFLFPPSQPIGWTIVLRKK
jgi:SAM-dependent methyltransferase